VRAGLIGQSLEQLEQLSGRRVRGQHDFADAVEVEALHQHRQPLALARHAVQLDTAPSRGDP